MIKSELILRIGGLSPDLHHREVERIVATVFDEIAIALARGGAASVPSPSSIAMRVPAATRVPALSLRSRTRSFPSSRPASN
jgi:hypothetical protein